MNFLNQKIINYDQMTNELKIADSSLPTDSQLSDFLAIVDAQNLHRLAFVAGLSRWIFLDFN
jgi:hypothetical protein